MVLRFYVALILLVICVLRNRATEKDFDSVDYTPHTPGFLSSQSPLHLMKLARLDRLLYLKLRGYKEVLERRLEIVREYTDDFERYSLEVPEVTADDSEHWIWATQTSSQPIRALRLIRRMASRLPNVLGQIENGAETELMRTIYEEKHGLEWPTEGDLEVIQESLLDIPIVFENIPVKHISEGKLLGNQFGITLDAAECNELGAAAYVRNRFASAIQWLDAAWTRLDTEDSQTISIQQLQGNLNEAAAEHDAQLSELIKSKAQLSQVWDQDLFDRNIADLAGYEGNSLRHLHGLELNTDNISPQVRFWQLCSGKNYQKPLERRSGICFYLRNAHPYLTINPFKVEVFNRFPLVVQIHDFVSQSTSIALISEGMSQIETLNGIQEGLTEEEIRKRLPAPAVLSNDTPHSLVKFDSKIKFLTKISGRSNSDHVTTERLHVGVYSFTNYDSSLDHFPDTVLSGEELQEQETLNVHLFLNMVDLGGQTVFPQLGFAVPPIQNSALIWSEYKMNGDGVRDQLWNNCPMISGNKWVASKYFRRVGINIRHINIFN